MNEETLFTDGDGYRNALNGIYKDLADFALYGRELTWGMNEVLGQTYHLNYIPSDHAYYYMAWSMYDNDKVEAILSSLWEQAYNAIANCNNLISHIAHADATLFSGKDMELNMIYGEALALRALFIWICCVFLLRHQLWLIRKSIFLIWRITVRYSVIGKA